MIEVGLYSLSDLTSDPHTGVRASAGQRIRDTVAAARLADEAGLDVFGVGEHHRLDFAVSSPGIVLAAVAAVTRRIRLTSAVSVLGASDPVRLFQDFATVDLLSEGRAELIVGRGAYVEPFPLFGFDTADYDALFAEKYELLKALGQQERLTWKGRFRAPIVDAEIAPRPHQAEMPVWIGVGGTPQSAARAGMLGAPMALAALGGPVSGLRPMIELYRAAGRQAGHAAGALKVAVTCHVHVGDTSQGARDTFFPHYVQYWEKASPRGRDRPRMGRAQFAQAAAAPSALLVGSPDQVAERMLHMHEVLDHDRILAQVDLGALPFAEVARVVERLATKVAPQVRAGVGRAAGDVGTVRRSGMRVG